jgi:hypothetical protein
LKQTAVQAGFEGTAKYNWAHCCIEHDLYLWAGGTKRHRNLADTQLKKTVLKKSSNSFHAYVMAMGVFFGKMSPNKN